MKGSRLVQSGSVRRRHVGGKGVVFLRVIAAATDRIILVAVSLPGKKRGPVGDGEWFISKRRWRDCARAVRSRWRWSRIRLRSCFWSIRRSLHCFARIKITPFLLFTLRSFPQSHNIEVLSWTSFFHPFLYGFIRSLEMFVCQQCKPSKKNPWIRLVLLFLFLLLWKIPRRRIIMMETRTTTNTPQMFSFQLKTPNG